MIQSRYQTSTQVIFANISAKLKGKLLKQFQTAAVYGQKNAKYDKNSTCNDSVKTSK